MDRNAFAVEALRAALVGIVVVDRRRTPDRSAGKDRPELGSEERESEREDAA
jgi:hypothetical protein